MIAGGMDNPDNKIQIITNSEIRYRGKLYQVNPMEKTIALREVISYGTEDRRADRIIQPVQTVYDCIVFRSTDIKELEVVANEEAGPNNNGPDGSQNAPEQNLPKQEAQLSNNEPVESNDIQSPQKQSADQQIFQQDNKNEADAQDSQVNKVDALNENQSAPKREDRNQGQQNQSQQNNDTYVRKNTGDNKQNYHNKRANSRDKDYKGPKPAYKVLRDAKGEFDFEAMAANMNEMEQYKEEFNQNNEEHFGGYAQDDFFDDISTS